MGLTWLSAIFEFILIGGRKRDSIVFRSAIFSFTFSVILDINGISHLAGSLTWKSLHLGGFLKLECQTPSKAEPEHSSYWPLDISPGGFNDFY